MPIRVRAFGATVLRAAAVLLVILIGTPAAGAASDGRVALVIGNGGYEAVSRLPNPTRDAEAIAASLRRIGFEVTHVTDLSADDMRRALRDFEVVATGAKIAIVFYAGHGIEVDGENYLIPVDAALQRDSHVEDETVPLSRVARAIDGASELRLVILDACRDNPFAARMQRTSAQRSIGRGLARIEPSAKTLVAYAAKGGTTAEDGDGQHSPFAEALLRHIETPGVEVNFLFRLVHDDVLAATGDRQEPFVYGSLGATPIYLAPPGETPETGTPAAPAGLGASAEADYFAAVAANTEEAYRAFLEGHPGSSRAESVTRLLTALVENKVWDDASDEDTVAAYQRYLAAFPDGTYASDAAARVSQLLEERRIASRGPPAPAAPDECGHPHGGYRVVGIARDDVLWVRAEPDRQGRQVGTLPPDATGIGVGECRSVSTSRSPWCRVRYKCVSGWSNSRYLADSAGATISGLGSGRETYRVTGVAATDVLNVRSGPGTQYGIVAEIPPYGSDIDVFRCSTVAGYSNRWCSVSWQQATGWTSACCLVGERSGRKPE